MASNPRLGHKGQKRSKAYYKKCSTGKRLCLERKLDINMKGFLVTCNRDERQCIRETYCLLGEYADELYGPEVDVDNKDEFDSDEGDIADAFEKELSQMNEQRKQKKLRFQALDSRAKNVVFIRTKMEDEPTNLVHHMLMKMKEAGICKSQHIQRILPISTTCRATLVEIEKAVKPLLAPFFHSPDSKDATFAVLFKSRNNVQIYRGEVITVVANAVTSASEYKHTVDLDDPDYSILVEVICNVCCMSVLKDYNSLKKYNLHAIVGDEQVQANQGRTTERCSNRDKSGEMSESKDEPNQNMDGTREISEDASTKAPVVSEAALELKDDKNRMGTGRAEELAKSKGEPGPEGREDGKQEEEKAKGSKVEDRKLVEEGGTTEEGDNLDEGIRIF